MVRLFCRVALIVCLCVAAVRAQEEAILPPFELRDNLPRHSGQYALPQIAWSVESRVGNAQRVFPDPALPDRIYVLAPLGRRSSTWKEAP